MSPHPSPDRLQVLVGHPAPTSRTHRAADQLANALATVPFLPQSPRTTALGALAGSLHRTDDAAVLDARQHVAEAQLLVVATPSYKGSLTGVLKSFLDLVPAGGLRETVVVPLVTAGSPVHGAQTDRHLRDVLDALDALLPTRSLVLPEQALDDVDGEIDRWVTRWAPVLTATLHGQGRQAAYQLAGAAR